MDASRLDDYATWVDQTPFAVRTAVLSAGGWQAVFARRPRLPLWAHRIRNYFNAEPLWLLRLTEKEGDALIGRLGAGIKLRNVHLRNRFLKTHPAFRDIDWVKKLPDPPKNLPNQGIFDDIGEKFALSDDVYRDNNGAHWFQMSPGGTIYHWGSEPWWPGFEAFIQMGKQPLLPVFKLIAPDGTGGSGETIIRNPQKYDLRLPMGQKVKIGRPWIGNVHLPEWVADQIVEDAWHRGSYNYAETTEVGLPQHERFDVDPHTRHKKVPRVYVNPDRRQPLYARRFPRTAPGETKPLAEQVDGP